jgi:acetyltransferase-like isoleucine patch superfamily enzyme
MNLKKCLLIVSIFLPSPFKIFLYRRIFKWDIGSHCKIGLSYIESGNVSLGDNVTICHFNIFKGIRELKIGDEAYIKNFNNFYGSPHFPDWPCALQIGTKAKIMSHHFIDVSGTITLGDDVIIGGRDTQIWSHTRLLKDKIPTLVHLPVWIENSTYIGARATLVGCKLPKNATIGAGSVITKDFSQEGEFILIAGNPGIVKRRYSSSNSE